MLLLRGAGKKRRKRGSVLLCRIPCEYCLSMYEHWKGSKGSKLEECVYPLAFHLCSCMLETLAWYIGSGHNSTYFIQLHIEIIHYISQMIALLCTTRNTLIRLVICRFSFIRVLYRHPVFTITTSSTNE